MLKRHHIIQADGLLILAVSSYTRLKGKDELPVGWNTLGGDSTLLPFTCILILFDVLLNGERGQ